MIDVSPYEHCACRRMQNSLSLCQGDLQIAEQGKTVRLTLRRNEEAKVLVLDGCVFTDADKKCDAVYLFKSKSKKVIALVELKGAQHLMKAFAQLAHTRFNRPQYGYIKNHLDQSGPGKCVEKAFVVSNGQLSKPEISRLENFHGIRVSAIVSSEPTANVPDLRGWLIA